MGRLVLLPIPGVPEMTLVVILLRCLLVLDAERQTKQKASKGPTSLLYGKPGETGVGVVHVTQQELAPKQRCAAPLDALKSSTTLPAELMSVAALAIAQISSTYLIISGAPANWEVAW